MSAEKLSKESLQERFLEALDGYVAGHSTTEVAPLEVEFTDPLPSYVRVYIFNVTAPPGGRPEGEHKIQLILPDQERGDRGAFDFSGDRTVLLVGYENERDVFVLWDAYLHHDFAYSKNVQVREETIETAENGAIGEQRRSLETGEEVVLTTTPENMADAIQRRIETSDMAPPNKEDHAQMQLDEDPGSQWAEEPDLYIMAVSEQRYNLFKQTVDVPYQIEDGSSPPSVVEEIESHRVWGIKSGERNERNFESLERGDIVVFYFNGLLFAAGRIGTTYDSPEAGEFLWEDNDRRYIFTLAEYQRIRISHAELWEMLGYSENFTVNGFKGPSSQAIENVREEVGDIWSYFMDHQTDRPLEDLIGPGSTGAVVDTPAGEPWTPPTNIFEETDLLPTIEHLHFPDTAATRSLVVQIDDALRSDQHIILTGPPGSGKTELAKAICEHYVNGEFAVATATDDWSTFDTIGGYRPKDDGTLQFKPGVFLRRFVDTQNPPTPTNEWLVIDELNRADIDKAFGPLFSALTGNTITLPFEDNGHEIEIIGDPEDTEQNTISNHRYFVPNDWRLIATMNTDDKASLYNMSYAFMRRFAFISVPTPDRGDATAELVHTYASLWGMDIPENAEWTEDIDPSVDVYEPLSTIWGAVQARKPMGPAFIEDILTLLLQQLRSGGDVDFTYGLCMHVFPQFEGAERDLEDLINELANNPEVDGFNGEYAKEVVDEFFDIDIDLR